MAERRPRPCGSVVACCALLREACLHMVRIRHAVVISEVTGNTSRRKALVHATRVAQGAACADMTSGEREGSTAVIKSPACKAGCGVTQRAVLWESGLNMVRVRRTVVVREMARYAC
jgi:hypothetical protein